jgi:archaellum component FlaG (FlaF/FlaG flagellin family)
LRSAALIWFITALVFIAGVLAGCSTSTTHLSYTKNQSQETHSGVSTGRSTSTYNLSKTKNQSQESKIL